MHGGRTFLLPMVAWLHTTYHRPRQEKRGALHGQQLRALPWQMHCSDVQWFLWHFKLCWSLRNTWQSSQDATAFNLARLARRSLICTDKGSFATQAEETKAKVHNKYKGLYQQADYSLHRAWLTHYPHWGLSIQTATLWPVCITNAGCQQKAFWSINSSQCLLLPAKKERTAVWSLQ